MLGVIRPRKYGFLYWPNGQLILDPLGSLGKRALIQSQGNSENYTFTKEELPALCLHAAGHT